MTLWWHSSWSRIWLLANSVLHWKIIIEQWMVVSFTLVLHHHLYLHGLKWVHPRVWFIYTESVLETATSLMAYIWEESVYQEYFDFSACLSGQWLYVNCSVSNIWWRDCSVSATMCIWKGCMKCDIVGTVLVEIGNACHERHAVIKCLDGKRPSISARRGLWLICYGCKDSCTKFTSGCCTTSWAVQ